MPITAAFDTVALAQQFSVTTVSVTTVSVDHHQQQQRHCCDL